jgi:hypothetical protein
MSTRRARAAQTLFWCLQGNLCSLQNCPWLFAFLLLASKRPKAMPLVKLMLLKPCSMPSCHILLVLEVNCIAANSLTRNNQSLHLTKNAQAEAGFVHLKITVRCMCCAGASPLFFSERAMKKLADRKTKVASYYFDLNLVGDYWGEHVAFLSPSECFPRT